MRRLLAASFLILVCAAAQAQYPDKAIRLVVATSDPRRLPSHSTWYLLTNRPRPDSPHATRSAHHSASLAEVVRCYGLRNWVEQGYKQVKGELGWADFQVRSTSAIRRHLTLVCVAFSYCWRDWFTHTPPNPDRPERGGAPTTGPQWTVRHHTRRTSHQQRHHGRSPYVGSAPG